MSRYILLIFLFLFLKGESQVSTPVQIISIDSPILKSVLEISIKLGIPKRNNLHKDSHIELYVDSDLMMFSAKYLMSYYKKSGEIVFEGTDSAYLTTPHIILSPLLYSVFYRKIDTIKTAIVKAESIIMHELAHYIQNTLSENYYMPKDLSKQEMEKYLGQPDELYASAVEAYYYYEQTDYQKLKKILKSGKNNIEIMKCLVSTRYNESYPWRNPICL